MIRVSAGIQLIFILLHAFDAHTLLDFFHSPVKGTNFNDANFVSRIRSFIGGRVYRFILLYGKILIFLLFSIFYQEKYHKVNILLFLSGYPVTFLQNIL